MKCPGCEQDSKKKEREEKGGACPTCGRKFRFDPPSPLSDYALEACVRRVSDDGKHRFSRDQLVCEVERLLLRSVRKTLRTLAVVLAVAGFVGVMVFALAVHTAVPLVLAVLAWFAAGGLLLLRPRRDPRAKETVEKYLSLGAAPPKLVVHTPAPSPRRLRDREFDLHSYGFDRVVVVDDPTMVDVLVGNNFHFEHNAAVLSMSRYPSHVADLVEKQLREPGSAKVYLLHDASAEGFERARQFVASGFTGKAPVVRLGLWPKTVPHVRPRSRATAAPPPDLPPDVTRALSRESVALAALRPAQVMTLLFNAFHQVDTGALVVVSYYGAPIDVIYDFG